eukprot:SAG11_NODE_9903_length_869_cov_1.211140_1_plen_77_part_10
MRASSPHDLAHNCAPVPNVMDMPASMGMSRCFLIFPFSPCKGVVHSAMLTHLPRRIDLTEEEAGEEAEDEAAAAAAE